MLNSASDSSYDPFDMARTFVRKLYASGQPRALFFRDGRLLDFPADGLMASRYLKRDDLNAVCLGIYDDGARLSDVLEDLNSLLGQ